jgi:signal transduction histidine kinase/CheY-like chemotaxis protein
MNQVKQNIENVMSKLIKIPIYNTNNNTPSSSNKDRKYLDENTVQLQLSSLHDNTLVKVEDNKTKDRSTLDFNVYLKMFIHELRTPISSISMGLDLLEADKPNKKTRNMIYDLKHSIAFIESIFSNFAGIQQGNIELNSFNPFSLDELLKLVEHHLSYHIKEGNIIFEYNIQPDICDWNYGDKYNIKHCIINLLKNAIKYREPSRTSLISIDVKKKINNVTFTPQPPSKLHSSNATLLTQSSRSIRSKNKQIIIISIKDNNEHILPHIKERLFESFNSTSGSGLGLYICKQIIDLHGGDISHYFIEPVGNEFVINLQLELCENPSLQIYSQSFRMFNRPTINENENENENESESERSRINIIIADDSHINRKLMYKILKKVNYMFHIYTTIDGNDTINKIKSVTDKIDIIILDKHMPIMDGITTTYELRKLPYNNLILGLTGDLDVSGNNMFVEKGADYVFIKPLDFTKVKMIEYFISKYGTVHMENKHIQEINGNLEWV